jgi:hypothetical protein
MLGFNSSQDKDVPVKLTVKHPGWKVHARGLHRSVQRKATSPRQSEPPVSGSSA